MDLTALRFTLAKGAPVENLVILGFLLELIVLELINRILGLLDRIPEPPGDDLLHAFSADVAIKDIIASSRRTPSSCSWSTLRGSSPFKFGFYLKPTGAFSVVDNVINAFFAVIIFIAYTDHKSYLLHDNPHKISWHYTTTWFILNVISTIPTKLACRILPSALRSYSFFGMLHL
ncbi:hypothetical protein E2562_016073 [Oryza meyeriana var. granulata]|uniref:Ion transport domain-containing protein n=1 Tax=Oryza meyeriana var. granulata TaxID=110450 RepID=A0A6G1BL22_9ORYZ|nr:hypothetical protein E2562_016073 [Oryza meyeriana var. granulata]